MLLLFLFPFLLCNTSVTVAIINDNTRYYQSVGRPPVISPFHNFSPLSYAVFKAKDTKKKAAMLTTHSVQQPGSMPLPMMTSSMMYMHPVVPPSGCLTASCMANSAVGVHYPMNTSMGHYFTPMYVFMGQRDSGAANPFAMGESAVSSLFALHPNAHPTLLPHASSCGSISTQSTTSSCTTPPLSNVGSPESSHRHRTEHSVAVWGFALVDQLHPFLQRVPVPPSCIRELTRGVSLYDNDVTSSSTKPCKSSVCLLHSQGLGCMDGPECRCFHVSQEYLSLCRATTEPLCCSLHNCCYSQEMLASNCAPHLNTRKYILCLDDSRFPLDGDNPYTFDISLLNLSLTVGLETLPCTDATHLISWKKHVCQLHQDGRCKWTKDCRRIHVCRQFGNTLEDLETLTTLKTLQSNEGPKNATDLHRDIILNEVTLRFVRSPAILPLVFDLAEKGDVNSLRALAKAKAAILSSQADFLEGLGVVVNKTESMRHSMVSWKVAGLLAPRRRK